MLFLPVLELMLGRLTTIQVMPHQCPSHQSILRTQGTIHKISWKSNENWRSWKMRFFEAAILNYFFQKKKKNCVISNHMRYHFFLHYGWFLQNLGKEAVRTNMHCSPCITNMNLNSKKLWLSCVIARPM
jgi:hypothetical protein